MTQGGMTQEQEDEVGPSDQAPDKPSGREAVKSDDPEALRRQAEEQVRRNATILREYPLPFTAEPAFVFRASSASSER